MAGGPDIVSFLEAGLRVTGLRGKVIANNLANLNTPGFRRGEVRFEQLLARAMASGAGADPLAVEPEVFQPESTPVNDRGSDVNMDLEVGLMVKNSAKSQVLLRALAKYYQQVASAIGEKV